MNCFAQPAYLVQIDAVRLRRIEEIPSYCERTSPLETSPDLADLFAWKCM